MTSDLVTRLRTECGEPHGYCQHCEHAEGGHAADCMQMLAADEIERLRAGIGKRDRELVGIRGDAMRLIATGEYDSAAIKTFLRRVVEADAYLDR